jgi:S1-C subfamily serine protease
MSRAAVQQQRRGSDRYRESSGRVILGDVITAIGGKKVESRNELFLTLENYKVGNAVILALLRYGKTIQAKLRLKQFSRRLRTARAVVIFCRRDLARRLDSHRARKR